MTTPNAARVAKVAEAKRAAGLKMVRSLWAHPDDHPAIRAYAAKLAQKRAGITLQRGRPKGK